MKRRLSFESLENKVVLSADVSLIGETGELRILGTGNDDLIDVNEVGNQIEVRVDNTETHQFTKADVSKIFFVGRNGDDQFTNNTSIKALALGSSGNDTLKGGSSDDRLVGGDGNDNLSGGSGDDQLVGGNGNDMMKGESGDDRLVGGRGDDDLLGGGGNDSLYGSHGLDDLFGHSGNDGLFGGDDNDKIYGGSGNDVSNGGNGDDWIRGYDGDDRLTGGNDNDTILGDAGIDRLYGRGGDDRIDGGDDDDFLIGNSGRDILRGQGGDDEVHGGGGFDDLFGGHGNDDLFGGDGNDLVDGGLGDDNCHGNRGRDDLRGSGGLDDLIGGQGDDSFKSDDDDYLDDYDGSHVDDNELHFYVRLSGTGFGKAEIELEQEDFGIKKEIKFKVGGLDPNTTYAVTVDGQNIGELTTNSLGFAEVEFSTHPKPGELQLPNLNSPLGVGSVLKVGDGLTGTVSNTPSTNGYFVKEGKNDDESEIHVRLNGNAPMYGKAEIEKETEDFGIKRELKVKVRNLPNFTTFDVLVDGEVIGQLSTDDRGRGEVRFSNDPDGDEIFLGDDVTFDDGTKISVGTVLEGIV